MTEAARSPPLTIGTTTDGCSRRTSDVGTTDRADAREAGRRAAARGRIPVRAEVGWLPRDRLSRRRRLSAEPRPAAARPLFSGAARSARGAIAERLRGGRRDRDRHAHRARLRRAAAAPAPGGVARPEAVARDAGL